ncbi:angiogenic factor with G patch and FHA domains 1 isoform X1 [Agrilus planipennis]|uniref:Angiogenic factor with G patch and FHA domains 1 isoform X1 n=1 Tax=Agrilus planipennis TaxID=224129 RepID=A0A1W4WS40_AGRPL|nr:angiogenic factor with G patch and FHA domains 1 isoform X1 [Agrilus planipennis]
MMEKPQSCTSETSGASEEDCSKSKCSHLSDKYHLNIDLENKLQEEYPEVIKLIRLLHKCIKKQRRKLNVLKGKLKKHKQTVEAGVQTGNSLETEVSKCNLETPGNITEEITQAAELAVQNSGFVFEETSGLYYDYSTGYYYNAELGLYYDGNTGIYMTYEASSNSYKFHSKVDIPSKNSEQELTRHRTKTKRKVSNQEKNQDSKKKCLPKKPNKNKISKEELEEGECSDTESTEEEESITSIDNEDSLDSDASKRWPPCMRIIVEESTVAKLRIGSLYIITYEGGSLGREGDHSILIPDINTSKHHLKFSFHKESNKFLVTDLGSRNGTVLNGKRMSASKQESEAHEVAHGSRIQIGTTILLCHIHNGNETCGLCEPGLVQNNTAEDNKGVIAPSLTKGTQHKKELQRLRKKFGITSQDNSNIQLASGYSDRAQARRETVGSHNEYEKTEVASVEQSIKPNNIGFKMLSKMGWSEGQALGKEGSGISEPIQPKANFNSAGLGSSQSEILTNQNENNTKGNIWKKTQKRFQQLPASQNIFEDEESD